MKYGRWAALGVGALAALGAGIAVKSFLPQRLPDGNWPEAYDEAPDLTIMPEIEVTFLRCGLLRTPELILVRGSLSLTLHDVAYSAVLIRHPQATFLYDTGLCNDIHVFLMKQPFFFRRTLAGFTLERSLAGHLRQLGLNPGDLDFVLLSHLHWDHVAGIPDIPGVPLRVSRTEYEAGQRRLFKLHNGLVPALMEGSKPDLFECDGPPYAGFRGSHDLLGDGSLVLVPLPGHTAGQVGMFINRSNGARLFLIGDAVHISDQYLRPALPHPLLWSMITSDDKAARQTIADLHRFSRQHPEIPLIAMHDAQMQESFKLIEQSGVIQMR
jgi:N-acyl homoserine lactone hydrolase